MRPRAVSGAFGSASAQQVEEQRSREPSFCMTTTLCLGGVGEGSRRLPPHALVAGSSTVIFTFRPGRTTITHGVPCTEARYLRELAVSTLLGAERRWMRRRRLEVPLNISGLVV
jgi:hypothetical protein